MEVIVFNTETDEEIGRESVVFSYARNSYWSARRQVTVTDNTDHSSVGIEFSGMN